MAKPKKLILKGEELGEIDGNGGNNMPISEALHKITTGYNKIVKENPGCSNVKVWFEMYVIGDRKENDDEYNGRIEREKREKQRLLITSEQEKALYEKLKLKYEGKTKT